MDRAPGHIVRAYDEELNRLDSLILRMGGLAESQLAESLRALQTGDEILAGRIREADARIDALHEETQAFVLRLLALRQPLADDLRRIFCALQISAAAERIGDYAANAAKRVRVLNEGPEIPVLDDLLVLGHVVHKEVREIFDAYACNDADRAIGVWERDVVADDMYTALFRNLLETMAANSSAVTTGVHLMFIAKNIERIGDHATNIAENIHLRVRGIPLTETRPRADGTAGDLDETS